MKAIFANPAVSRSPLVRYANKPIMNPHEMPVDCSAVFNCGAVRFQDEVLLLLRLEDSARVAHLHTATSRDGITFDVNPEPIIYLERKIERLHSCRHRFDIRITPFKDTFYVCHAVWLNPYGSMVGLARTDDFVSFEPVGGLTVPSNRNAVMFPEKIDGRYVRIE